MSVPSWVHIDAKCVCVDEFWVGDFDCTILGPNPVRGEVYTIAAVYNLGSRVYVSLRETTVAPDYFSIEGFKPVVPLESDVELFNSILRGAAASSRRELVPA